MSVQPTLSNNYKTWDVRLIWTVNYPSILYASSLSPESFEIYGADRSATTVNRPLTRNSSLEQYNQGYIEGIPDIRITIFTKESGPSFEKMRRLSTSKIPFDISLILASDLSDPNLENNAHEGIWIDGYEEYLGCRVTSERLNYTVAEFPVREFECMALRRRIMNSTQLATLYPNDFSAEFGVMIEGDGTYVTKIPTG